MAFEKPSQKSESFGFQQEYQSLPGILAGTVLLPLEILGGVISSLF